MSVNVTLPGGPGVTFGSVGITGFVGATIGNFPALYGVTGTIGVSISNTGLGVTFVQLSSQGITGNVGLTGSVGITGVISTTLGSTLGKTNIFKFGMAAVTGNTPAIAFCTYMVSGTKSFFLQAYTIEARFTAVGALAAGVTFLGTAALMSPAGTTLALHNFLSTSGPVDRVIIPFSEPPSFGPSTIINLVVTPGQSTSITWAGNIMGYER